MVILNLGEMEFERKADVVNTLEELARAIDAYLLPYGVTEGNVYEYLILG